MQMHADELEDLKKRQINISRHCDVKMLQDKITQLSTNFGRLVGEVSALRSVATRIEILLEQISSEKMQHDVTHCHSISDIEFSVRNCEKTIFLEI
jgi:uncharacterized membrane protein